MSQVKYSDPGLTLNTAATIPSLGLGVYQLEGEECKELVLQALKTGYRLIDTAQFYRNENAVGQAVRESGIPREEIFITTKVQAGAHTVEGCKRKVEKSLSDLGLDYIDLFLIHGPLMGPEKRVDTWSNLVDFMHRSEGKIRAVGVSNFGIAHLEALREEGLEIPSVNQIELHPHLPQTPIVDYCKSKGIVIQAYCPLMRGQQNQASLGEGAGWAGKAGFGWDHEGLKGVAEKENMTIGQVLLKWSIQKGYCPQAKTSSPTRLKENLDVLHLPPLSEESMNELEKMNLEGREEEVGRLALEWNPVDCP
ncbi:hypothetical protein FFLO_04962 [Filobasidium floriforme]|uniref:NADP-dependent oxidoreductase domain-containing protein n=1 Tax=Filobasidium floriforme TaxID=5210 RepID=A0A8K0NNP6_9TREE|nr:Aldo/keto reductase [Filobasidium floriforme]KAG7530536.1 hypothetical protein FFLO_04962 [Filobasidium floriforme]KAH8080103.1 Aldo/keto reductase [Filobasidium floriforme]